VEEFIFNSVDSFLYAYLSSWVVCVLTKLFELGDSVVDNFAPDDRQCSCLSSVKKSQKVINTFPIYSRSKLGSPVVVRCCYEQTQHRLISVTSLVYSVTAW
jgi:hypothetical protein